jgi:xanthine dehydrogenase accessory factor
MVCSREKVEEVKEQLLARGAPRDCLDRVHIPVGLELGAEAPEEIAAGVMAEIFKIKRGNPL